MYAWPSHIARVWINRVKCCQSCSWSAEQENEYFLVPVRAPENLVLLDGFGRPVPPQPAHSQHSRLNLDARREFRYHGFDLSRGIYIYRKDRSLGTPPRLTFQARLLNQEGANAEKGGFRKISSRAFFRRIGRCSHPLGCGAIEPGKSV